MRTGILNQLLIIGLLAGCTGERAKEATSTVIGKAVELGKGTASGIAEGVEEGRKDAPSADGAAVVTKWEDLAAHGAIAVIGKAAPDGAKQTVVDLAIENKGDVPLRLSGVEILGFDAEGFTLTPTSPSIDQTVPPKAKVKAQVSFAAEPAKVAKIRIWTEELAVP
jgi:hypothetical protein